MIRLEHGNLTVKNVDETVAFLRTAFPEFRVRGGGMSPDGVRWAHVGNDDYYVALSEPAREAAAGHVPYDGSVGFNHLGWVVDDADALRERLLSAGYRESTYPNAHPHRRRVYFYDPSGNDWEFVEYLSDDPAERNDYALPDR